MGRKSLRADDLDKINQYSDMVYRMAFSLLKNKYDAEDVHQDVFVRYLKARPEFANAQHEKAWFLRVTVNLCKNFWKAAWHQRVVGLEEEDLDRQAVVGTEEEDEIVSIVKKLPQKYRIVIHLFYYEELSTEEIAEILKMKPSTVRTQLTRARAKLKEVLEKAQIP